MFRLVSILSLFSIILYASVSPLHVEVNIYKNISFMTKRYSLSGTKVVSLHAPSQISLEDIIIETKGCKKESIKLSSAKPLKTQAEEKLKLKIIDLNNQIISFQENNRLLKTLSLKEKNLQTAQRTLKFFTKNYALNLQQISTLNRELNRAKKELQEIQNQKAKSYKLLAVRFTCRDRGNASITYPQYDFRIDNFYKINGNPKDKSLTFTKKIKIIQKSGEDFKNIDIVSHSNNYNQRVQPSPFFPKYLNIYKRKVLYAKSVNAMVEDSVMQPIAETKYMQNFTTFAFVLKGVNLPNNQEKIITLEDKKYLVSFQNDIDGYASNLAYLKASFKSDKYYRNSRAYIELEGDQIGIINLKRIKKAQKVDIYFGENQNIKIKKTLLKRYNESEFFGNNQINTQVWQYKITNQYSKTQKINLIERIPISQNEDIKIEPLFDTKKAKINKKGRVIWSFSLPPNETKTIKFGYKTIKPKSEKR